MIFIYESIIGDPIWGHKRDQPFPVGLGLVGLGGFGPPPGRPKSAFSEAVESGVL